MKFTIMDMNNHKISFPKEERAFQPTSRQKESTEIMALINYEVHVCSVPFLSLKN